MKRLAGRTKSSLEANPPTDVQLAPASPEYQIPPMASPA